MTLRDPSLIAAELTRLDREIMQLSRSVMARRQEIARDERRLQALRDEVRHLLLERRMDTK